MLYDAVQHGGHEPTWLVNTWNVASVPEEPNFKFISFKFKEPPEANIVLYVNEVKFKLKNI